MPSPTYYKRLQNFAEKTAIKAGKLLLKEQDKVTIVKYKDKQDIATTADLKSEKLIISEIEKAYPKHSIFSEEIGLINNNSQYTWVVDPLDGTQQYAKGLPLFAVLISCETQTNIISSCVHIPKTHEIYSAAHKCGSFDSGKKLKVSNQSRLSHSIVYTHPLSNKVKEPEFSRLWKLTAKAINSCYRVRPTIYDAQILSWLAKGALDAYFLLHDTGAMWWDIASGLLIAKEAGAKITDRFGKPIKPGNLEKGIVVSNGKIHDQLLKLLNE